MNPFSNNRREGEREKIFLFYPDTSLWFSNANFIFEGHRGSGKTSILSAFNYENVWLKQSEIVPDNSVKYHYDNPLPSFIGVVFKCELHDKDAWERWAKQYGEENASIVYATYLNYYFLEQILGALDRISQTYDLSDKSFIDNEFIQRFIEIAFPIRKNQPKFFDYSLYSLQTIFREFHNTIRQNVINLISFEEIQQYSYLHEKSSKLLVDECKLIQSHYNKLSETLFFILIDDVNRVSNWQTRCINTLIVSYEYPVSFKLSSVLGLHKTKATCDPERPIGNSDAKTICLGYSDPTKVTQLADIKNLLNVIFKSRIKQVYPNAIISDIDSIFGVEMDINASLLKILKSSQKNEVKQEIEDYEKSEEKFFTDYWLKKNSIKNGYKSESSLERTKENSEYLKKYRLAAAFSIIQEYSLGNRFEYSSMNVINHLICGSVRRFLKICEFLWSEIELQINQKGELEVIRGDKQSEAIRKCAEDVYKGIDSVVFLRNEIDTTNQKLCDRLAKIFLSYISKDSLRVTTECLSFKISKDSLSPDLQGVVNSIVLSEAFIKVDFDNYFLIGLHPVLSPKYALPYRSPFYYPQSISKQDFDSIVFSKDTDMPNIYNRLLRLRTNIDNSPNLFDQFQS